MSLVTELKIKRNESYQANAGQLSGSVLIEGENGRQEIRLSASTIASIFELIRGQASATAKANAGAVSGAIADASAEAGLLENKSFIEGEKA